MIAGLMLRIARKKKSFGAPSSRCRRDHADRDDPPEVLTGDLVGEEHLLQLPPHVAQEPLRGAGPGGDGLAEALGPEREAGDSQRETVVGQRDRLAGHLDHDLVALAGDGIRLPSVREDRHGSSLCRDRLDRLEDLRPSGHRTAVDGDDLVTASEPCTRRRGSGDHGDRERPLDGLEVHVAGDLHGLEAGWKFGLQWHHPSVTLHLHGERRSPGDVQQSRLQAAWISDEGALDGAQAISSAQAQVSEGACSGASRPHRADQRPGRRDPDAPRPVRRPRRLDADRPLGARLGLHPHRQRLSAGHRPHELAIQRQPLRSAHDLQQPITLGEPRRCRRRNPRAREAAPWGRSRRGHRCGRSHPPRRRPV